MSKFIVKGGTRCFISSVGHNNFYYPSEKSVNTLYDVEAERVSWAGGGDMFVPVIVPSDCIDDDRPSKERSVVWMKKE